MRKKAISNVFDYQDYKSYLRDLLGESRGSQAKLAAHLKCHSGYLSQVLRGSAHLSQEQAIEVGRFFKHPKNATHYFVLLVGLDRAGTQGLRDHYKEQMKELLENQKVLKTRLKVDYEITESDRAMIYSSWHFVAVHIALLVPKLRSIATIAKYLNLPQLKVREVIETLVRIGLVKERNGEFVVGPTHVHLPHDSPMIHKHHANWRMKAIQSFDKIKDNDLHYSSVVAMGASDIPRVREILVRAIEDVRSTVKNSVSAETLQCYCIDWFGIEEA